MIICGLLAAELAEDCVTTNKVPFLMNRQFLDARLTKVQEYKIYVCIHSGNDVITIT